MRKSNFWEVRVFNYLSVSKKQWNVRLNLRQKWQSPKNETCKLKITGNRKANDDHHWRRQRDHLPVPAVVCGTPKRKRGFISKHVHYQLARCNKWYYYLLLPMSKSLGINYQGIKTTTTIILITMHLAVVGRVMRAVKTVVVHRRPSVVRLSSFHTSGLYTSRVLCPPLSLLSHNCRSSAAHLNPFNASCSKLLLFKGFSAILV